MGNYPIHIYWIYDALLYSLGTKKVNKNSFETNPKAVRRLIQSNTDTINIYFFQRQYDAIPQSTMVFDGICLNMFVYVYFV